MQLNIVTNVIRYALSDKTDIKNDKENHYLLEMYAARNATRNATPKKRVLNHQHSCPADNRT